MRKALLDSLVWRGLYFLSTLVLNVCIARVYEANKTGWIYFISNNFYLMLLIGGLSLDSSTTYFSASNRISPHKLAMFSMTWPFVVAGFSVLCTGVLIGTGYITSSYIFLFTAGAAYTFGISLTNFFTSLFYARQNFALPNIFMSAVNVLVIILTPFFAKGYFGLNTSGFLYVYFIQFIVQGFGLALLYVKNYSPISALQFPKKDELRLLFRFALIALSANIAYYLIYRIDYLFVEKWCSAKSLGNYVQVSRMGQLLLIIPQIVSGAVYPQAAKGETPNVVKMILRMTVLFCLLYLFIIVFALLFSNSLFIMLFGGTFDEMSFPFLLLLPGIMFLSMHIIMAAYFGGKNKPSYNVISTTAGLVVVLIGDVLLIRRMGIAGAALVSTLGYTTAFAVSLFLFLKKTGSSVKDIFSADTFRLKTYTALFINPSSNAG